MGKRKPLKPDAYIKKDARPVERHHRLPRSRGGTDTFPPGNIVTIEREVHRAWHKVVGNMTAEEVAAMLTDHLIDPRYYLVAVPRDKAHPKARRKRRYCVDCECEILQHIPKKEKSDE